MYINLSQHCATEDQKACGVFDINDKNKKLLVNCLNFNNIPDREEIEYKVEKIIEIAESEFPKDVEVKGAMIGGALWLMAPLARGLKQAGFTPFFAFSKRVVIETPFPDGSVKKEAVFKHMGFVEAF